MNSIEERFNKISKANQNWAPYVCLAEAITHRSYNNKTIRRNFLKLVPKEDYEFDIERELIAELGRLLRPPMNVQNGT
jgi:hypothetical protein